MRDVVPFTQQQQIVQVGAATVDPMDAVVGVQVLVFGQPGWAQWPC